MSDKPTLNEALTQAHEAHDLNPSYMWCDRCKSELRQGVTFEPHEAINEIAAAAARELRGESEAMIDAGDPSMNAVDALQDMASRFEKVVEEHK